ncbi:MAG: response regulator, partial [Cyanobacteria bacterium J06649_11]
MTLNSYSILLLKTNRSDIECLEQMLLPHKFIMVNNLSEAESVLREKYIDAVILDLSLNTIGDFEIISSVSLLMNHLAVVVITNNENEEALQKAIKLGADEVVIIKKNNSHFKRRLIS